MVLSFRLGSLGIEIVKTYLISDSHLNHDNIATYCDRPTNFTELILKNWRQVVKPEDVTIHLGDVAIGNRRAVKDMLQDIPGRKILIRGNHDWNHSNSWWMENGFDFSCDAMIFRGAWLTHRPAEALPKGCNVNVHGHLHNIWNGFHPNDPKEGEISSFESETLMMENKKLYNAWQRLFAVEYTNYQPVEFDKFIAHPDKYQARGPKKS